MQYANILRGFLAFTVVMRLGGCGETRNQQRSSSTAPSVGDTVTARYDVSGLLFVLPAPNTIDGPDLGLPPATAPSLFANAISYSQQSPSQAARIDSLKNYIRDNIETESWKNQRCTISSETTDRRTTALLITNTPAVQRKVEALLDGLRKTLVPKQSPATTPEVGE